MPWVPIDHSHTSYLSLTKDGCAVQDQLEVTLFFWGYWLALIDLFLLLYIAIQAPKITIKSTSAVFLKTVFKPWTSSSLVERYKTSITSSQQLHYPQAWVLDNFSSSQLMSFWLHQSNSQMVSYDPDPMVSTLPAIVLPWLAIGIAPIYCVIPWGEKLGWILNKYLLPHRSR